MRSSRPTRTLFLSESFTRPARINGWPNSGSPQSHSFSPGAPPSGSSPSCQQIAEHADCARRRTCSSTPRHPAREPAAGRPRHVRIRAVLAGRRWPVLGVYSGYELFEIRTGAGGQRGVPRLREIRAAPRDFEAGGRGRSLSQAIARLNEIRRAARRCANCAPLLPPRRQRGALRTARPTRSPATSSGGGHAGTRSPRGGNGVAGHAGLGMPYDRFWVRDEITGENTSGARPTTSVSSPPGDVRTS